MRDLKIYIIIASILLIVYLVAQYNKPTPVNWTETYSKTDKIPYGAYIIYNQLHDIFPGAKVQPYREPVYNVINDHNIQHANYIIICGDINLNEYDYAKLIKFISKGNNIFIAARLFGSQFQKELKVQTSSELWYNKLQANLRFTNKTLDTTQTYSIDKNTGDGYFNSVDTVKALVLGKNNLNHINFIKYNFGKGTLYLNTNPLMFTNYSLLKPNSAEYAALALSHLKNEDNLIWDEYYSAGREGEKSPMRVFLRNNALRSSYYIALLSLLIFVLYQIKRRQRIIPIIEPLQNSTLEFVNVVGQVYYEQRNNSNIAQKKAGYFLENLRTRYNLKTNVLNDEFATLLMHKSGVGQTLVNDLLSRLIMVRNGTAVTDQQLIDLNKNIEQFYLQSR